MAQDQDDQQDAGQAHEEPAYISKFVRVALGVLRVRAAAAR